MNAVKLESLKNDIDAEEKGEWIQSTAYPGVSYLVRSIENSDYRKARDIVFRDIAKTYGGKPVPEDVSTKIVAELFSNHIVIGWKGLDVEWSKEKTLEIFTSRHFRDFKDDINLAATKVGKREIEFVEDAAKN